MPLAVDTASAARSDEAETASWHGTIERAGVEMRDEIRNAFCQLHNFPSWASNRYAE
jgi:hypothetical protein